MDPRRRTTGDGAAAVGVGETMVTWAEHVVPAAIRGRGVSPRAWSPEAYSRTEGGRLRSNMWTVSTKRIVLLR